MYRLTVLLFLEEEFVQVQDHFRFLFFVKGIMFFSISNVPLFSLSLKLCLTTKRVKEHEQTCCLEDLI